MTFNFCPDCGSELTHRDLGDDKNVPWCTRCDRPWFAMFSVATISLVYNDKKEVLLLRQNYISTKFHNLVSGYVTPGECAEQCAEREILEETGLKVDNLQLKLTSWFEKKGILMVGFFAHVKEGELCLSSEVDSAEWMPAERIPEMVSDRPGSTSRLLSELFIQNIL